MLRLVLLRILESYFRHRWLYLLPIILMWGVAGVFVSRDPSYMAHGILYVEQASFLPSIIPSQDTGRGWETPAEQTSHEIAELLQTNVFIRTVIMNTDMEENMDKGNAVVAQTISNAREAVWTAAPGRNQVGVFAVHVDPVIAYQLVNATVEQYTQWKINTNQAEGETSLNFYNNQLEKYTANMIIASKELENYLAANPEPDRGNRTTTEEMEIERLRDTLGSARTDHVETLRAMERVELALSQAESSVHQTYIFMDAPFIPEEPQATLRDAAVQIVMFTVVGIILSFIGIVAGMLLDRSFRFPIDVQYGIHLPVIASIPDIK